MPAVAASWWPKLRERLTSTMMRPPRKLVADGVKRAIRAAVVDQHDLVSTAAGKLLDDSADALENGPTFPVRYTSARRCSGLAARCVRRPCRPAVSTQTRFILSRGERSERNRRAGRESWRPVQSHRIASTVILLLAAAGCSQSPPPQNAPAASPPSQAMPSAPAAHRPAAGRLCAFARRDPRGNAGAVEHQRSVARGHQRASDRTAADRVPKKAFHGLRPNAAPRICRCHRAKTTVGRAIGFRGASVTTSNVASVEARIGGYAVGAFKKTGVGRFASTYTVAPLPWFVHGKFTMQVIAKNTRAAMWPPKRFRLRCANAAAAVVSAARRDPGRFGNGAGLYGVGIICGCT